MGTSDDPDRVPAAPVDGPSAPGGPGAVNPAALSVEQLARMLGVPQETLRRHLAAGAPAGADGRVNLVHYAAWLNRELASLGENDGDCPGEPEPERADPAGQRHAGQRGPDAVALAQADGRRRAAGRRWHARPPRAVRPLAGRRDGQTPPGEGRLRRPKPSKPDNHWFDCLVGCAVAASMVGIKSAGEEASSGRRRLRYTREDLRRRLVQ
jgi:hypothetical protein